jgi:hypothetical protein
VVDKRHGGVDACARCFGSGKCTQCQPVTVVDLGSPYGLPTRPEADEDPEPSTGAGA